MNRIPSITLLLTALLLAAGSACKKQTEPVDNRISVNPETFSSHGRAVFEKWQLSKPKYTGIPMLPPSEFKTRADHDRFMLMLNNMHCRCGCNLTLAECRHEDPSCQVSPPVITALAGALRRGEGFSAAGAMPGFELTDINTSQQVNLVDSNDEDSAAILVTFWAKWCSPCLAEIEVINRLHKKHKGRLKIMALSIEDDLPLSQIRAQVKELGISYPVYRSNAALQKAWLAENIPATFVLDAGGLLEHRFTGLHTFEQMDKVVSGVINQ